MPELVKLLLTALVSFIVCLLVGPFSIKMLHQLKFGQSIRAEGPQTHLKKAGTPTMGGIFILFALVVGLFVTQAFTRKVIWLLGLTLSFGLIGFIDDLIIIITKKSMGLKARQKFFLQLVFAGIAAVFLLQSRTAVSQLVPFSNLKLTFLHTGVGNPLFVLYAVFIIAGFSNAVNFTDGLDGLAGGTTAIAALALGAFALFQGSQFSVAVFAMALAGACFGFIWFNGPPAQVFMGDTGSLALGAAIGGIALLSRASLFLPIIGGIFVAEILSVVIQVASFKTSGKRVFRMSPIHHHFELGGMVEPKIMVRFWMVGLVLAVFGILGYFIK